MFNLQELKQNELKIENQNDEQSEEETPINVNNTEPTIKLQSVEPKTLEENEIVLLSVYDKNEDPPAYKERGVGNLKILRHKDTKQVRILMRRDKTLKLCANHYLIQNMRLGQNKSSQLSLIWAAINDFADEVAKNETFACRFKTQEDMELFRKIFTECVDELTSKEDLTNDSTDKLEKSIKNITLNESVKSDTKESEENKVDDAENSQKEHEDKAEKQTQGA